MKAEPTKLGTIIHAGFLVAFGLLLGDTAVAQVPLPTVSPDPLPDVPSTSGDPFPFFDNYSWRSFIALNWPALSGSAHRGEPDRTKSFSDTTGPRVWATWKSRYEIFQPNGQKPGAWTSYDGHNPCGDGFANDVVTLSSFSAFSDFNQANFSLTDIGNPLVTQSRTYLRYEIRVNQQEFNSIVDNTWFVADKLPTSVTAMPFNKGSTEVKAAWRILSDSEPPAIRGRYYVVPNAQVFDVASQKCLVRDIALVGLHIVTKTPNRPQWIWSTFEHVDNVPAITTEPRPPAGVPFLLNDASQPQALNPLHRPAAISSTNPPVTNPAPMQVIRRQQIKTPQTMDINQKYWDLAEIKGTVWQNYMLITTQWPTQIAPETPANDGAPFPTAGSALANTTMETYFQSSGSSCMECHFLSNQQGRDFVMFVTFDAFRPSAPSPADLFAAKVTADKSSQVEPPLSADPLVKSLVKFFDAAK